MPGAGRCQGQTASLNWNREKLGGVDPSARSPAQQSGGPVRRRAVDLFVDLVEIRPTDSEDQNRQVLDAIRICVLTQRVLYAAAEPRLHDRAHGVLGDVGSLPLRHHSRVVNSAKNVGIGRRYSLRKIGVLTWIPVDVGEELFRA